jgi:hypothetical protein
MGRNAAGRASAHEDADHLIGSVRNGVVRAVIGLQLPKLALQEVDEVYATRLSVQP